MKKCADGTFKFEVNDIIPELSEFLKDCDVSQIYFGKDHCCRCGCGGKYFDKNDVSEMTRNIKRANKFLHKNPTECELYIGSDENYLNVPTVLHGMGRAITIYFKGSPHFN